MEQVIKKSKMINKNPEFCYKYIQVFTSMRIFPTRKLLHQQAKRMGKDYEEEEEEFVDDDVEDVAYWKGLAKWLKAENSVLRKRVAAAEAQL